MALKLIDLTTPQPGGKFGDPTKTAWEKANDNFTELAAGVQEGAAGGAAGLQALSKVNALEDELGTAAMADSTSFATAYQGNLAATAVQPVALVPIEQRLASVESSQGSGVIGVAALADVPVGSLGPGEAGRLYSVTNDPISTNNGTWRWTGAALVQAADITTGLSQEVAQVKEGNFPAVGLRMETMHPWTGYGWGLRGADGLYPLAIRLDGTVDTKKISTSRLNGLGLYALDSWTGYCWAVGGSNGKYALAVTTGGAVEVSSLVTEKINGIDVAAALAEKTLYSPDGTQEWWISPVHTTLRAPYERIVSGTYSSTGEIVASEYVPGLGLTKREILGKTGQVDDHNAPGLWAKDGRRMVIAWTEHNETNRIDMRVSSADGNVSSFLDAPVVSLDLGRATSYTQIHRVEHLSDAAQDTFWMFTRLGSVDWALVVFSVAQDTGAVTQQGPAKVVFVGDGQYYVTSADAHANGAQVLRLAAGYNPAAPLNAVHYYEIDVVTGAMSTPTGALSANVLTGAGLPLAPADVVPVLPQTDAAVDRRLFYVRPGPISPAIAYAEWPVSDATQARYKVAVFNGSAWTTRDHGPSGPSFGYSESYIAGVSFPDPCQRDVVMVAYRDVPAGQDVLEEQSVSSGGTIRVVELERRNDGRIIRPIVPTNGSPLCVYSSITSYGATWFTFTGNIRSAIRR